VSRRLFVFVTLFTMAQFVNLKKFTNEAGTLLNRVVQVRPLRRFRFQGK
jgi:hypothetical protein